MAQPVLVRAYPSRRRRTDGVHGGSSSAKALPPVSSFAFAHILRAADSPEFQTAIDGIAEICAKNRLSLADEYGAHLPPLGEITAATSHTMKPHLLRPGMRPALTSVPEASSGSSEGSRKSKKRTSMFGFRRQPVPESKPMRRVRIGSMGRTVPVGSTTALAEEPWILSMQIRHNPDDTSTRPESRAVLARRAPSDAQSSLQRLLAARGGSAGG